MTYPIELALPNTKLSIHARFGPAIYVTSTKHISPRNFNSADFSCSMGVWVLVDRENGVQYTSTHCDKTKPEPKLTSRTFVEH